VRLGALIKRGRRELQSNSCATKPHSGTSGTSERGARRYGARRYGVRRYGVRKYPVINGSRELARLECYLLDMTWQR